MANAEVFCGQMLTIVVDDATLTIHRELLVRTSDYFRALGNNGMLETYDCRAVLHDVEEDTFLRFVEWAYTGDYNNTGSRRDVFESFTIPWYTTCSQEWSAACLMPLPVQSTVNFVRGPEVFRDLLKLWAFADKYLVTGLKQLAGDRFEYHSRIYGLDYLEASDIKSLLIEIYENLGDATELRTAICACVARDYKNLLSDTDFLEFWRLGGQHVLDVEQYVTDFKTSQQRHTWQD